MRRHSQEHIDIARRTARSAGAVGARAVVPRYVASIVKRGDAVLNFGAGIPDRATGKYIHSEMLRAKGADVDEYDFNQTYHTNLRDEYDIVFASNVMNVQSSLKMMEETMLEMRYFLKTGGLAIFNYPKSPRKSDLSVEDVARTATHIFGGSVYRVGGTKSEPILEVMAR